MSLLEDSLAFSSWNSNLKVNNKEYVLMLFHRAHFLYFRAVQIACNASPHAEVAAYNIAKVLGCQAESSKLDRTILLPTPSPSGNLGRGFGRPAWGCCDCRKTHFQHPSFTKGRKTICLLLFNNCYRNPLVMFWKCPGLPRFTHSHASFHHFLRSCRFTVTEIHYLFNIMNGTAHQPLNIHLAFAPECEPCQPFRPTDIPEYRFRNRHSLTVYFATIFGINLIPHLDNIVIPAIRSLEDTPGTWKIMVNTLLTKWTGTAILLFRDIMVVKWGRESADNAMNTNVQVHHFLSHGWRFF
jgi:hypothetical protein